MGLASYSLTYAFCRWVHDGLVHQPRQFDRAFNHLFAKELSQPGIASPEPEAWAVQQFWRAKPNKLDMKQRRAALEIKSRYRSDFQVCCL